MITQEDGRNTRPLGRRASWLGSNIKKKDGRSAPWLRQRKAARSELGLPLSRSRHHSVRLPSKGAALGEARQPPRGLAEHHVAVAAQHHGLRVAEDRRNLRLRDEKQPSVTKRHQK